MARSELNRTAVAGVRIDVAIVVVVDEDADIDDSADSAPAGVESLVANVQVAGDAQGRPFDVSQRLQGSADAGRRHGVAAARTHGGRRPRAPPAGGSDAGGDSVGADGYGRHADIEHEPTGGMKWRILASPHGQRSGRPQTIRFGWILRRDATLPKRCAPEQQEAVAARPRQRMKPRLRLTSR